MLKTCNVEEARKRFAKTIAAAQLEPVVLTKHGRPVAVVLGAEHADLDKLEATMADLTQLHARRRRS